MVSAREPAPPPYSDQGEFVELRYVRYGEQSTTVALFFGIIEELAFPQCVQAKLRCAAYLPSCSFATQKLFAFLFHPRIRAKHVRTAWNSGPEFVHAVIQACAEVIGYRASGEREVAAEFASALGVSLTFDWRSVQAGKCSGIVMEERENATVLLYRTREMESFTTTECGHIVDVCGMIGSGQAGEGRTVCPYRDCGVDISRTMRQAKAARTAETCPTSQELLSAIYSDCDVLQAYNTQTPGLCSYCDANAGQAICENGCLLCDHCAVTATFTRFQLRCPLCGERIVKTHREVVFQKLREMGNAEVALICESCGFVKALGEYARSWKGEHRCVICADCISRSAQYCPGCSTPTDSLAPLPAQTRESEEPGKGSGMRCSLCVKPSDYTNFSLYFGLGHKCAICDDCYLLSLSQVGSGSTCPKCGASLPPNAVAMVSQITQYRSMAQTTPSVCQLCQMPKSAWEMVIRSKLDHSCAMCDLCMRRTRDVRVCPMCGERFPPQHIAFLCAVFPKTALSQGLCACGKPTSKRENAVGCASKCACPECNLKHFLLTKKTECPKCRRFCQNLPLAADFRCTNCDKRFDVDSAVPSKRVCGVCASGCILCVYCVQLRGEECVCMCGGEVTLSATSIAEVATVQSGFSLGCFCGKEVGPRDVLPCGHEVHRECRNRLRFCRMCPKARRDRESGRGLCEYVGRD